MTPLTTGVVVVGAGISGLIAATELVANGVACVVVEARDRVGGRLLSEPLPGHPGAWIDQGGQWLGPSQERAYELAARLGLTTMPTHVTGNKLLHFGGRLTQYSGRIPRLPPLALADVGQAQWRFDRLARTVDLAHPWRTPDADRLDAQTFDTWITRTARTAAGRDFFRVAAQAVFATEAANLSLLHALFYARSGNDLEFLLSSAEGAQQDRIVGGAQQLPQGLADRLGDRVLLGHPVRRVAQTNAGVVVQAAGATIEASFVIISLPPALTASLDFDPVLPADRAQLLQRMPHGSVVKFHAVYDTPFWRDAGLSGEAASDTGPVKVVFDNSPPDASVGILVGFFEGADAVTASRHSVAVRRNVVRSELQRYFGPAAAAIRDYTDTDWNAEPFTRGCYGAHLPPGAWTQFGSALRRPFERIHWAGTETAQRWVGYIEGGTESGIRAADEVLARIPR